jgi:hypothetical protein
MRSALAIATGLAVVFSAVSAFAFEQTPEAPPATTAAPTAQPPALALGTPSTAAAAKPAGTKSFGLGLLPKLDFGLELLYGDRQQPQLQMEQSTLPELDNDVTVVGKFKKQF